MNVRKGSLRIIAVTIMITIVVSAIVAIFCFFNYICTGREVSLAEWLIILVPIAVSIFLCSVPLFLRLVGPCWRETFEFIDFDVRMCENTSTTLLIILPIIAVMIIGGFYIGVNELYKTTTFQIAFSLVYVLFGTYIAVRFGVVPLVRWILVGFSDTE